jgi:hypothetical protein
LKVHGWFGTCICPSNLKWQEQQQGEQKQYRFLREGIHGWPAIPSWKSYLNKNADIQHIIMGELRQKCHAIAY